MRVVKVMGEESRGEHAHFYRTVTQDLEGVGGEDLRDRSAWPVHSTFMGTMARGQTTISTLLLGGSGTHIQGQE